MIALNPHTSLQSKMDPTASRHDASFKMFRFKLILIFSIYAWTAASASEKRNSNIWDDIDIVPMPKEIRLTGKDLVLKPEQAVLIIGKNSFRQSQIGAEWINKRIIDLGGSPLAVLDENGETNAHATKIVIGTRQDNALIEASAKEGILNLGPGNPGVRGYEIRASTDGKYIYVGGSDPVGALYGCITLGEMLESRPSGSPLFRAVDVRDWPDIQYLYVSKFDPPSKVGVLDTPEGRKAYHARMMNMYEEMMRRKLSMVWYKPGTWGEKAFRDMSPASRETVRLSIEAGKERGISSMCYPLQPFVGLKEDYPNIPDELLEQRTKGRYSNWIRSWSMDEERHAYGRELAQWAKDVGFTDVGFHDTDTGGYLNPANWNNRGAADLKRWGDDYTAATINKFRIYYEELKKANPDIRVNFTLYPYNSEIFDPSEKVKEVLRQRYHITADELDTYRKRYVDFWQRLNKAFPPDVAFAIREPSSEDGGPGLKAFRSYNAGRPVFAWYSLAATEFYNSVPAWLGTLSSGSVDDIIFAQNIYVDRGFVPILTMAMREYSWNTRAPGAASFKGRDRAKAYASAACDIDSPAYTVMLPHLVRNYFGRALADDITEALMQNCSPFIVFGGRPDNYITDESAPRMNLEKGKADAAALAMDKAWQKLGGLSNTIKLDSQAALRVAYLRQVFHATSLIASIKETIYRSQSFSSLNKFDDASASIRNAALQLANGEKDLREFAAEGPNSLNALPYSAKVSLDKTIPLLRKLIEQRTTLIAANKNSGGIPLHILGALSEKKSIAVAMASSAPQIDGLAGESAWKDAYPVQACFLVGRDAVVADAETRFKVLATEDSVCIYFKCWAPSGEDLEMKDESREFVRVYFQVPSSDGPKLSAFAIWANGKVESSDKSQAEVIEWKTALQKSMWEGEIRIPFKSIGLASRADSCRLGLVRGYSQSGSNQVSAIVPIAPDIAGSFEAAAPLMSKFPLLQWEDKPFKASAKIHIRNAKIREATLDDRIASIADFSIAVSSDSILDNVRIQAEAISSDGAVETRTPLLTIPRLKFDFARAEPFSIAFLQASKSGSIRVKMVSDQLECEAVHRFESESP